MASTQVNGHRSMIAEHHVQAAFYDQWLQLKDNVLADRHPRFKLPAAVKQRLQPAAEPPTTSSQSLASQLPGLSNGSSREQAMSGSSYGAAARLGNAQAFSQNTSTATGTNATKSGIDPILLTKSEDLIRAEMQLKRQRIERQLKDAADQRKHNAHFRNTEEAPPLVNLSETFSKALEMVKPISGLKPAANPQTAASDSFDENSYYSSQANDWSSEEGSPKEKVEAIHTASSASIPKKHPVEFESLDKQPHPSSQAFAQHENEALYDAEREDSEEYSPPDANAFSGPDGDADAMDLDDGKCFLFVLDTARLSIASDSSEFVPQDAYVPSPQAPVITSHLTQVAAPQPARVSPLTMVKPPGLGQSQTSYPSASNNQHPASPHAYQSSSAYRQQFESDDSTTSPRNSTQTSPNGAYKKPRGKGNKKRKRDAEAHSTKARKTRNKPAAPSPEPYIKPEPVSPPPFAAPPALQSVRTRPYQLPSDVEIVSGPRQTYYQEPPPPSHYGLDGVSSPSVIRVSSPGVYGRPRRDDQDLRRVASLHAAHRPVSPMGRIASPAGYRTVSQPFPERTSRYGDEVMRAPQTQYLRSERSVTPPHLRAAREAPMSTMAPPPLPPTRRIVVDQYGNRYYANEPEVSSRMSVAPQLRPEPEMMYERAPSRQSVIYASQPTHSVYEDEHGTRMPPPPPPPVRRMVEQPEAMPTDYRAYRQREYSRAPEPQYYRDEAAGPVYIREAPGGRASVYPPEAAPGPYAPRAYSVRPDMEPVRYMSRQPSMAPQSEFVRMAEAGGRAATMAPPPAPMRGVSVVPGSEYGRPVDMRYSYGAGQAAGSYAGPGARYGEEGSAAPREIYVDQYGREVRRVGY
ncbi:hypothetical protein D6C85_06577 [Aureobasidium pullulans]|uniref:Uncharacterized protein n=1 Tax=Aureobasidium pullulans TaxID=5580 RepID=A0A4S9WUA0_AURPU|nr:hypothetical protein D6C85_06577 [Aureobasidium pullulans]